MFSHTVALRCVWQGELSDYSFRGIEVMEGLRCVFTSVIRAKSLNGVSSRVFHDTYNLSKSVHNLALVRYKINPQFSWEIICKHDEVSHSTCGINFEWSAHVKIDQFQDFQGVKCSLPRHLGSSVFTEWQPLHIYFENWMLEMPLTNPKLIIRCMPRVWKCPNLLCQRVACERWSEFTSGPKVVKLPPSLYKPLMLSLGVWMLLRQG